MHMLTQGCSMRQQPQVQPKGLLLLLCSLWVHLHLWGWDAKSHGSAQTPVGLSSPRAESGLGWLCLANLQFLLCYQHVLPGQVLLLAVLYAETGLYAAYSLSSAFGNLCTCMVYLCFWKRAWLTQKHKESCIPDAFVMIWLCFLGILGIHSTVWSPSNHILARRPGLHELMAWAGIGYLQP